MKKTLPRKSIFLILFMSMAFLFAAAMIIIELLPDPVPEFQAVNDTVETNEDTALTIKVLDNDLDLDKETLEITEFTQSAHGRVAKTTTGLRYIPNVNYFGEDTFTYTIKNSLGATSTATVTINVKSVNDTPNANRDYYTTTQNVSALIDVLINDTDIDGDDLTIQSFYDLPNNGTIVIEDGKIRYTPNEGFIGVDEFAYRAKDSSGASDTAIVTVSVLAPQD